MVSYSRLQHRMSLPRASGPWMQDSGGFNELRLHGRYRASPREYAERTRLHREEIGNLEYAAIQDWMCEDEVLERTQSTVPLHQLRTVESYLDLRELAPEVPWMPVLQGRVLDDYRRHADMYAAAGVGLPSLSLVGLGTICRRQHTMVAVRLVQGLRDLQLRLHGFGLKMTALVRLREHLASADSMAWSLRARYGGQCRRVRNHATCRNCCDFALVWRERLLRQLEQLTLFGDMSS
jgi:hypothetical protein